jgi:hypothetical protein
VPTSPTGWIAIFNPWRAEPVVGWDDHGYALIVDAKTGKQVDVHDLEDHRFCNLEPADLPFVGALPADGWTVRWSDGETDRVIGFGVRSDGHTIPILDQPGGHGDPYYADPNDVSARLVPPPRS